MAVRLAKLGCGGTPDALGPKACPKGRRDDSLFSRARTVPLGEASQAQPSEH